MYLPTHYWYSPFQINKQIPLATGIALWISVSWSRSTTQVWGWRWACRERLNSSVCLRLVLCCHLEATTYLYHYCSSWHWLSCCLFPILSPRRQRPQVCSQWAKRMLKGYIHYSRQTSASFTSAPTYQCRKWSTGSCHGRMWLTPMWWRSD